MLEAPDKLMEAAITRSNAKQGINRADIFLMLTQLIYFCKRLNGKCCRKAFCSGVSLFEDKREKPSGRSPSKTLNLDNFITHGEQYPCYISVLLRASDRGNTGKNTAGQT